jgi:hypothetical protein
MLQVLRSRPFARISPTGSLRPLPRPVPWLLRHQHGRFFHPSRPHQDWVDFPVEVYHSLHDSGIPWYSALFFGGVFTRMLAYPIMFPFRSRARSSEEQSEGPLASAATHILDEQQRALISRGQPPEELKRWDEIQQHRFNAMLSKHSSENMRKYGIYLAETSSYLLLAVNLHAITLVDQSSAVDLNTQVTAELAAALGESSILLKGVTTTCVLVRLISSSKTLRRWMEKTPVWLVEPLSIAAIVFISVGSIFLPFPSTLCIFGFVLTNFYDLAVLKTSSTKRHDIKKPNLAVLKPGYAATKLSMDVFDAKNKPGESGIPTAGPSVALPKGSGAKTPTAALPQRYNKR